jgi:serine/threonine-protein kinase haspin
VYGKRPTALTSFAVSEDFTSSSPKTQRGEVTAKSADVEVTVQALKSLQIQDGKEQVSIRPGARRALRARDNNVPVQKPEYPKEKPVDRTEQNVLKTDFPSELGTSASKHQSVVTSIPSQEETVETFSRLAGPTPPQTFADSHISPLLSLDYGNSTQLPTSFSSWSATLEPYFNIVKIAEASYGEVYRLCLKHTHPKFTTSDESVLKILPLKPPPTSTRKKTAAQLNRELQMSEVQNVASEVQLLQRMSPIPGFTNFRGVLVLHGRPSKVFADAWKTFNKAQPKGEKSVFPDPSKKSSYREDQLWAVIEMQDAGSDLEHVRLDTVWEVWDVFWGVALALGKGEEEARFEHRDLHLGNICVRSSRKNEKVEEMTVRNIKRKKMGFTGLETTIIDYTLSRAEIGSEEQVAYLDLEQQEDLFEQDASQEYQYEIYRRMRSAVYHGKPTEQYEHLEHTSNASRSAWKDFHPLTSLVWLHFVLHKLLEGPIRWPSKDMEATLGVLHDTEDHSEAQRLAENLEMALTQLEKLLDLGNMPIEGLGSVRDLIAIAVEEGWLEESDVVGSIENGVLPKAVVVNTKKSPTRYRK